MSFFEKAGKFAIDAGKATMEAAERKAARINKYKEKLDCLSDEELFIKLKHPANQDESFACQMVLRERGYGNKE